ncbi:hypothetical protein [Streptomyces sp. NPDC055055]
MLLTEKGKPDTTSRAVLQCLAEFAHADGTHARPSLLRLQYRSGYDRRTVQRALRRLEVAGLIVKAGTVHGCVDWTLRMALRRPAGAWQDLKAAEEADKAAAAERQRRSRARRVTPCATGAVTCAHTVTDEGVVESGPAPHAPLGRDVTDDASSRHVARAARTTPDPSSEPPPSLDDGRRPTTASRPSRKDAPGRPQGEEVSAAAVGCVIAMLPYRLRERLPSPVPRALVEEIRAELGREITTLQLVDRMTRRWQQHGYEADAESVEGPGIRKAVGVALSLIRRGDCSSTRCDDGTDLDTGNPCRTCERERQDRAQTPAPPTPRRPGLPELLPAPRGEQRPTYTPPSYAERMEQIQAAVTADGATPGGS